MISLSTKDRCILGLDVGEKTIGVALSDPDKFRAVAGQTIFRTGNIKQDMTVLREFIVENSVSEIVIGLPLMMDGSRGIQVEKIEAFVAKLRGSVRVPIHYQDERLSTKAAAGMMVGQHKTRQEKKKVIDSVAAALLLQTFMDARNRAKKLEGDGA